MSNVLKITALVAAAFGIVLSGCFEYDPPTWDDDTAFVRFQAAADGSMSRTVTVPFDETEPVPTGVTVQLAGPRQPENITARFEIIDESSTAVEGEHYEIDVGNFVTIQSGTSYADIPVSILSEHFSPAQSEEIAFRLTEDSDVAVLGNYGEFYMAIGKAEVVLNAALAGLEDFSDVEGSIQVEGNTPEEMFTADISLEGLEPQSTYTWALYQGTCESTEPVVLGEVEAYPEMVTAEESTEASTQATVDVLLGPSDTINVRVYQEEVLVVCEQING